MTRDPAPPKPPGKQPERDPALEQRIDAAIARRLAGDPLLQPHQEVLRQRMRYLAMHRKKLFGDEPLLQVADWHERFGLHRDKAGWVLREWLPNATAVLLTGRSNTTWVGGTLPVPIPGAPGCDVLTSSDAASPATAGGTGAAKVAIPVPNQPSLIGASVYHQ